MESNSYKVSLEFFEGPLDLLLYLIRRDEVDISQISISHVTSQYLAYLETFQLLNLDLASEFISMAANLMYIKSRTLLPKHEQAPEDEDEEDDPRWDLIRQLIEYKKFKEAAGYLSQREIQQEFLFAHSPPKEEKIAPEEPVPLAEVSIFDLIRSFQNVLKRFEEARDFGDIIDDRHTVNDKIEFLLEKIKPGESMSLSDLFQDAVSKIEVIVTFLALLELMKMNQFSAHQDHLLGQIEIQRKA